MIRYDDEEDASGSQACVGARCHPLEVEGAIAIVSDDELIKARQVRQGGPREAKQRRGIFNSEWTYSCVKSFGDKLV
jgi:hypothetical protein